jgi:hypothetical protein
MRLLNQPSATKPPDDRALGSDDAHVPPGAAAAPVRRPAGGHSRYRRMVARASSKRCFGSRRDLMEMSTTVRPSMPQPTRTAARAPDTVELFWLPLGAGDHVVKTVGRVYEALVAARDRRERCDLYHAALQVRVDGSRYVVESAPAWDRAAPDRGVVGEGAVFLPLLGRSTWFRYEVRRWRGGVIPDAWAAVDGPRRIPTDRHRVERILELAPSFPTRTWGRDELRVGDMWNSNSLIAWLLATSGHDTAAIRPPARGRAPGWNAGLIAARPIAVHDGHGRR